MFYFFSIGIFLFFILGIFFIAFFVPKIEKKTKIFPSQTTSLVPLNNSQTHIPNIRVESKYEFINNSYDRHFAVEQINKWWAENDVQHSINGYHIRVDNKDGKNIIWSFYIASDSYTQTFTNSEEGAFYTFHLFGTINSVYDKDRYEFTVVVFKYNTGYIWGVDPFYNDFIMKHKDEENHHLLDIDKKYGIYANSYWHKFT